MKRYAITPSCPTCGQTLMKTTSGLVCPDGHGRIVPLEEFVDRSLVAVDHSQCPRQKVLATSAACRQLERAVRALKRLEAKDAQREGTLA